MDSIELIEGRIRDKQALLKAVRSIPIPEGETVEPVRVMIDLVEENIEELEEILSVVRAEKRQEGRHAS